MEALAQVRERVADAKPRQLFKDLIKLVPSDDNEVVSIQHTHFAGQMRRERRKTSCLPGKDPKIWTDFKANLPRNSPRPLEARNLPGGNIFK